MHTVAALLGFVVVIHWLIFPYPPGLLHWHCGNLTIAPVPAKQPWWIWINTSCKFIINDCITTTKQSTTKPCAYFLGYTVNPMTHAFQMAMIDNHGQWPRGVIGNYVGVHPAITRRIIRLFVHYTISSSSLCKLIWRHWTYKMPVRYNDTISLSWRHWTAKMLVSTFCRVCV